MSFGIVVDPVEVKNRVKQWISDAFTPNKRVESIFKTLEKCKKVLDNLPDCDAKEIEEILLEIEVSFAVKKSIESLRRKPSV